MFTLVSQHLFWWPVTVRMPDPIETGRINSHTFEMRFEATPQEEAIAYQEELAALPLADQARRQNEQLMRVAKGWREVVDESGNAVPFSVESLKAAMQFTWFREGVWTAYMDGLSGTEARAPARLGN